MTGLLGSVVIPAHNEAAVIERSLRALLAGIAPGTVEVVVACNGCTDGTADVVRRSGLPVRVVEIETPSKIAALRAGEAVVTAFPRVFVDADVVLPGHALLALLTRLAAGDVLAGRPPVRYDTAGADRLVRAYYRARTRIPSVMTALWGAGTYAVTADGRERIGPWPDVLADDLFVDRCFRRDEIAVLAGEPVVVAVPRTRAALMAVLTRTYAGKGDEPPASGGRRTLPSTVRGLVLGVARDPGGTSDFAVYAGFAVLARLRRLRRTGQRWERDETTRRQPGVRAA
jgi:hypothetical protein